MSVSLFLVIVLLANCHISKSQSDDDLVVTLKQPNSKIRGHILKSHDGKEFYAFQEIPYALPPVGKLRFQEAQPHPGWEGILNTTESKKVCYQPSGGTEDCLVINVYTPIKPGSGKLPVFFWIHGGAFQVGDCTLARLGPQYLMDHGIVVVTVQYRLGPLGFLTTADGVIAGNLGLKDQLLGLKWVNRNIAVFGGDPKKVTIGGVSAGAGSVSAHIISQKSTGLYRAAIMESGSALMDAGWVPNPRDYAFQLGKIVAPYFNGSSSVELIRILQAATPQNILKAASQVKSKAKQVAVMAPPLWAGVIEEYGDNRFLTEPMEQIMITGKFDKVPILTGFNSEEMIAFITSKDQLIKDAAEHDVDDGSIISERLNIPQSNVSAAGEQLKKMYTSTTFSKDLRSYVELSSELFFVNPTLRQAELTSRHKVPVYLYEFSYEGATHVGVNISGVEGAAHAEETRYVWYQQKLSAPKDILVQNTMTKLWVNFIKTLNPTPDTTDPILGNFTWPRVKTPTNMEYINLNRTITVESSPKRYEAVRQLFEKFQRPPYVVF